MQIPKTSDICISGLVQQTAFSNFVLTLWLRDTYHFSLLQLLMLPTFINSLSRRKKKSSSNLSCLKVVLPQASLEGGERAERGAMHCRAPSTDSSIRPLGFALLCLLCTTVETMERTPPKAILSNYFVEVINDTACLSSKHFPTRIHCV